MSTTLEKINEDLYKTHDLIRILCDTIENCRRNQRHPVYIDTLCEILYEQSRKSVTALDEYINDENDD